MQITSEELRQHRQRSQEASGLVARHDDDLALALYVLHKAFGRAWLEANIPLQSKGHAGNGSDFISNALIFPGKNDKSEAQKSHFSHRRRVIVLADMIFNLQSVSGISNVLDEIRTDSVEAYYAMLVAGKLLKRNQIFFQYLPEEKVGAPNYDAEIVLPDGRILPCEMKCKVETAKFSNNSFFGALDRGRQQLPSDQPGVILISVPEWWQRDFPAIPYEHAEGLGLFRSQSKPGHEEVVLLTDPLTSSVTEQQNIFFATVDKLFRSSKRIAYVVVYSDYLYTNFFGRDDHFDRLVEKHGLPENTTTLYDTNAMSFKNPDSPFSDSLPITLFLLKANDSNWLYLKDV